MNFLSLTFKSMLHRRTTTVLTILVIAISVTLLLGVEKVRTEARQSFANTIAGTDLVVGARSGAVQLLLYAVFRIGDATNNISYESYQEVLEHPNIAWSVPLSLGDSHKGFRVIGTNLDYFRYYKYGHDRSLSFAKGDEFVGLFDAVIGADVARELDYNIGQSIVLAHGTNEVNLRKHDDKPFTVVGILNKTGTPVDRSIHVSLEAIEAIHIDWQEGVPIPSQAISAEEVQKLKLEPRAITAFLLGTKSKMGIFALQRDINDYRREPLLAILPGVALQDLWKLLGVAEQALLVVSGFVVLSGLIGMLSAILASLRERRREIAILRSVGVRTWQVFTLLATEALAYTVSGCLLGVGLLYAILYATRPIIATRYGLYIEIAPPTLYDFGLLGIVILAGLTMGLIPAARAYQQSLSDGMTVKI